MPRGGRCWGRTRKTWAQRMTEEPARLLVGNWWVGIQEGPQESRYRERRGRPAWGPALQTQSWNWDREPGCVDVGVTEG